MTFHIESGTLRRDGQPFVAVGVTYHPRLVGARIWVDWQPDLIDDDLRQIAASGLNTVRVFVFWRDLQPLPDIIDSRVLDRVRTFVHLAATHDLACILSVFTIWMNGQRLDLPWRHGRSLWRDTDLLDQAERCIRELARALVGQHNVLALDLGDEIRNVDPTEADQLSQADVVAWQSRMAAAAQAELPGVPVTQANDVSGVLGNAAFGPDNSVGLDLIAVHGWPMWSPGAIESTSSVKASQLSSFLVRYARAHGPVLLDEIGGYGTADEILAGYLRTAGASALAAGAVGAIAWCWQDIAARTEPYQERPGERHAGLMRLDGTPKPALAAWRGNAELATALVGFRPDPPEVGLYLPQRIRATATSYLDAPVGTIAAFYAHLLLARAHLPYAVVAGTDADLSRYRLMIVASTARLTLADRDLLRRYVTDGGTLYVSVADHVHGWPDEDLSGVGPLDFSLITAGARNLSWDDDRWQLHWDLPGLRRVDMRPTTARVVARYTDGTPAATVNQAGAGRVIVSGAPIELMLNQPGRLDEVPWHTFYRRIAAAAGVQPVGAAGLAPDLEIVSGWHGDDRLTVLINHSSGSMPVPLPPLGYPTRETLPPKSWALVENGRLARRCPAPDTGIN
ncbi:cellulase family glycosylhydrolase [Micromonospora sp. NPDC049662]|uniref:cellulase family glycosylhydrolase n=1 Tax=Micromonospora sp. NPDC049662 TaxID=3155397 RepID=UPI00343AECA5